MHINESEFLLNQVMPIMITRQKIILFIGIALAAFVIFMPPFSRPVQYASNADVTEEKAFVPERNYTAAQDFIGFYFLISGPPAGEGIDQPAPKIFMRVWLIELLLVFIFTVYGIYLARNRSDEADRKHAPINEDELNAPKAATPGQQTVPRESRT